MIPNMSISASATRSSPPIDLQRQYSIAASLGVIDRHCMRIQRDLRACVVVSIRAAQSSAAGAKELLTKFPPPRPSLVTNFKQMIESFSSPTMRLSIFRQSIVSIRKVHNSRLTPPLFVPKHLSGWLKDHAAGLHATYVRKRHSLV